MKKRSPNILRARVGRRLQIAAAVVLTIAVGAVFYYSFFPSRIARRPAPPATTSAQAVIRHPLTGSAQQAVDDFFAISVMYDNFSDVKIRPGLEHAAVVYEALSEGGITRLMAVFDGSALVDTIGPIRSVRPYFIDWASEYGGVLMHVGGSNEALSILSENPDLLDIDQIGADEIYFVRDENVRSPHNVFSSRSSWLRIKDRFTIPHKRLTPWKFAEAPASEGPEQQQFQLYFSPGNHVAWVYNKPRNSYIRFTNGKRELFETGDQISAANIIIIEVPTETIDRIGRLKMKTLGQGEALIFSSGKLVRARWIKETRESRMRFISDQQEEVIFSPGASWIEVVPSLAIVAQTVK